MRIAFLTCISCVFFLKQELTALFGAEWAIEHLIPAVDEILVHESYLRRLTALQACSMMATVIDPDTARLELLPKILEMALDNVSTRMPPVDVSLDAFGMFLI